MTVGDILALRREEKAEPQTLACTVDDDDPEFCPSSAEIMVHNAIL